MPVLVTLPALSPTMQKGVLVRWLMKEGESVKFGDCIAEVETDKAVMEVEAVDYGILAKILIQPSKSMVAVGTPIAVIQLKKDTEADLESFISSISSGSLENSNKNNKANIEEKQSEGQIMTIKAPSYPNNLNETESNAAERVFISPLAARIAKNNNINPANISGSGPRGRVVKDDVMKAISKGSAIFSTNSDNPRTQAVADESMQISPIRAAIADRLVLAKSTIPHFYLDLDCNVTSLLQFRQSLNDLKIKSSDGEIVKISINDIIIKASAMAMKRYKNINASWSGDSIVHYGSVDISVAVSLNDGGLITPIIKSADNLGLAELSSISKKLASRARARELMLEEFTGGGFTISNLGMMNIKSFKAIINPPQSAILAVGATEKRPICASDGSFIAADIMSLSISVDHRVVDGAQAAEFLYYIKQILENPLLLSI